MSSCILYFGCVHVFSRRFSLNRRLTIPGAMVVFILKTFASTSVPTRRPNDKASSRNDARCNGGGNVQHLCIFPAPTRRPKNKAPSRPYGALPLALDAVLIDVPLFRVVNRSTFCSPGCPVRPFLLPVWAGGGAPWVEPSHKSSSQAPRASCGKRRRGRQC